MRGIRLAAIDPEIGFVRLAAARVEDRQGSLVGVQDCALQQGHFAGFREHADPVFPLAQPAAEGGAGDRYARPQILGLLPVQRQVIDMFHRHHVGHQARRGQAFVDHLRR